MPCSRAPRRISSSITDGFMRSRTLPCSPEVQLAGHVDQLGHRLDRRPRLGLADLAGERDEPREDALGRDAAWRSVTVRFGWRMSNRATAWLPAVRCSARTAGSGSGSSGRGGSGSRAWRSARPAARAPRGASSADTTGIRACHGLLDDERRRLFPSVEACVRDLRLVGLEIEDGGGRDALRWLARTLPWAEVDTGDGDRDGGQSNDAAVAVRRRAGAMMAGMTILLTRGEQAAAPSPVSLAPHLRAAHTGGRFGRRVPTPCSWPHWWQVPWLPSRRAPGDSIAVPCRER